MLAQWCLFTFGKNDNAETQRTPGHRSEEEAEFTGCSRREGGVAGLCRGGWGPRLRDWLALCSARLWLGGIEIARSLLGYRLSRRRFSCPIYEPAKSRFRWALRVWCRPRDAWGPRCPDWRRAVHASGILGPAFAALTSRGCRRIAQ